MTSFVVSRLDRFVSDLRLVRRAVPLLLWLALGLPAIGAGSPIKFQPPEKWIHPTVAATPAELARLQAALASPGPERAAVSRLVEQADRALQDPITFPPRGGQHNQWYQCEACQMGLKTIDATHHECPKCGKVYSGPPYDDVLFGRVHGRNIGAMGNAAWAYALTGDERYAAPARTVLLGYAERYRQYPYHDSRLGTAMKSGGHLAEQTLNESAMLAQQIAPAYDLIYNSPSLSPADHRQIREGLLVPMLENLARNPTGKNNWQSYHNAGMLAGGIMLHDAAWIERAINDPENGFVKQMEISIGADGLWYENSWGYHFYTLGALVSTAESARRIGLDLWGDARFRRMFTLPANYVMPTGGLPRFADDPDTSPRSRPNEFEAAWHAFRDPSLQPCLSDRPTFASVMYGRKITAGAALPELKSALYPGAGHAILRGPAPAGLTSVLCFGEYGGFHGHLDKNNFVFFAHGEELGYDPGRARSQAYRLPIHVNWYKATLSHNTVLVDRKPQEPATGKLLQFEPDGRFAVASSANNDSYPGVEHARVLAQGPRYLLVIDQLRADRPRRFDWVYHNLGDTIATDAKVTPGEVEDYAGMEFVRNQKLGTSDGPVSVTIESQKVRTRVLVDGQVGTGVLIADGPGPSVLERVPMTMITRTGTAATFAVVLDPVRAGDKPFVSSVKVTRADGGLEVIVETTAGTDRFAIAPDYKVTIR